MKAILFPGPMGLAQTFTTLRMGSQWLKDLKEGDDLTLESPQGLFFGVARAVDVWNGDLAVVPASLLELSSDPLARTYSGAIMALRASNPKTDVLPDSNVTVIVFEFLRAERNAILT